MCREGSTPQLIQAGENSWVAVTTLGLAEAALTNVWLSIVGWSMQETMTSQLVVDALMMGVWRARRYACAVGGGNQPLMRASPSVRLRSPSRSP
jgi:hypothetical protein